MAWCQSGPARISGVAFLAAQGEGKGSGIGGAFGQPYYGPCGAHRNDVIFNDAQASSEYVGDMILIRSWMCLKAKVKGFSASFSDWSSNPAVSLYQL